MPSRPAHAQSVADSIQLYRGGGLSPSEAWCEIAEAIGDKSVEETLQSLSPYEQDSVRLLYRRRPEALDRLARHAPAAGSPLHALLKWCETQPQERERRGVWASMDPLSIFVQAIWGAVGWSFIVAALVWLGLFVGLGIGRAALPPWDAIFFYPALPMVGIVFAPMILAMDVITLLVWYVMMAFEVETVMIRIAAMVFLLLGWVAMGILLRNCPFA